MADSSIHPSSTRFERSGDPGRQRSARSPGIRLTNLFGIEVSLDWSLLVIAFLVAFNLGAGLLPAWHPEWGGGLRWSVAVAASVLFIGSVLIHELSHALVGRRVGVPIRHITLFLFGGMAHMESEPQRPRAEFLTAIAGPLTSGALGFACLGLAMALGPAAPDAAAVDPSWLRLFGPVPTLLLWLGPINILLAVFNMVPGFPLDGGRVLRSILWWATGDFRVATFWASIAGQAVGWSLVAAGISMMFGFAVPVLGTGFVAGLWSMLIGWFLSVAARRSYEQVLMNLALDRVPVARILSSRVDSVSPDVRLDTFIHERLLHSDQRAFPVLLDQRFLGLVTLAGVRKIPEAEWGRATVAAAMTPAHELPAVSPSDDARQVAELLSKNALEQVPVIDDGRFVGLVRRRDLLNWTALRSGSSQPGAERERPAS